METQEFYGILDIDCPGLTDEQVREIETGNPDEVTLPNGLTVNEYAAKVAALKQARLDVVVGSWLMGDAPKEEPVKKPEDEDPASDEESSSEEE